MSNAELTTSGGHEQMDALARSGGLQKVGGQYAQAMSVQKPRDDIEVETKLIRESKRAGKSFFYTWGSGKNAIVGPSIKLQMAAVRLWGNAVVEMRPVQETADSWIFTAAYVDLETGFTLMRQFRQSKKWTVYGKFDDERKDDIRFQIGQSKAVRNVLNNALPSWLIDKAVDAARGSVREEMEGKIERLGIEKVQKGALQALAKHGITEQQILEKYGRKTVPALDIDDLVLLKADQEALDTGMDNVESLYPPKDSNGSGNSASRVAPSDLNDSLPEESEEDKPKQKRGTKKKEDPKPEAPQSTVFDEWASEIKAATTIDALHFALSKIEGDKNSGKLTSAESKQLVDLCGEKEKTITESKPG